MGDVLRSLGHWGGVAAGATWRAFRRLPVKGQVVVGVIVLAFAAAPFSRPVGSMMAPTASPAVPVTLAPVTAATATRASDQPTPSPAPSATPPATAAPTPTGTPVAAAQPSPRPAVMMARINAVNDIRPDTKTSEADAALEFQRVLTCVQVYYPDLTEGKIADQIYTGWLNSSRATTLLAWAKVFC